jgi:hypothetical protein
MFTNSNGPRLAVVILSLGFVAATTQLAAAGWAESHPRRAEVNARLDFQNWRINHEFREGEITAARRARFTRKTASFAPRSASTPRSTAATSLPPSSARSTNRRTRSAGELGPEAVHVGPYSVSAALWSPNGAPFSLTR